MVNSIYTIWQCRFEYGTTLITNHIMNKNIRFLLLVLSCLVLGCQPKDPRAKNLVPGRGQILLNDVPLAGASISFNTAPDNKFGISSAGRSDGHGNFTLTTFLPKDGTHPGNYFVSISATEAAGEFIPPPEFRSLISERYNDPQTSGIVVEIPAKGSRNIVINLQSE